MRSPLVRSLVCGLLACGLLACGEMPGADPADPSGLIAGFRPPAAQADETVYRSPIVDGIEPGKDLTLCTYVDQRFPDATDVTHFRVFQSEAGHHVILYAAVKPRPVGTHVCNDDDMLNSRFVAAGGSESGASKIFDLSIPPGLAFRLPAGAQLMFQTHWINATQEPIEKGQAVAYLVQEPARADRQVLDLVNFISTDFAVPSRQTGKASTTCVIKRDLKLYSLDGHQHEWGSRVDIELLDGASSTMLWSHPWIPEYQFDPPVNVYSVEKPLLLKAGQSVRVSCEWNNTTAGELRFPREMCVGSGFYFPATGSIDCEEGFWSESSPAS